LLPSSGPGTESARRASNVQVVDIDAQVARKLLAQRRQPLFSDTLGHQRAASRIGSGDTLEVSLWESPPATLFGGGSLDPRLPSSSRATTLPEQMVDSEGYISVPFAGRIRAAGQSPQQVEALVRVTRNASATVTVVGEVTNSTRMPLTAGGERLLDALAAAGGTRAPINKVTLQVTRGQQFQSLPLEQVIRDPAQNVPLQPGDVVTALFQTLSFTALGATGKNEEINFEAQGITLAQALARVGGLVDSRSDAQGLFLFRFEPLQALDWPRQPVATTPEGLVPVIYRLDLKDPASFFVMQNFAVQNKDVLYVSNAPASELQKFLNMVFSVIYPIAATRQLFP
jgi:polysaccharide biosynthesis/export protein